MPVSTKELLLGYNGHSGSFVRCGDLLYIEVMGEAYAFVCIFPLIARKLLAYLSIFPYYL